MEDEVESCSAPEPQWKQNDRRCAECAERIRANAVIRALFDELVSPPWSLDGFAAAIASYHLVKDVPSDEEVRQMNADFLKELKVFRDALKKYQRVSGESFPTLLQSLCSIEIREWAKRSVSLEAKRGVFHFASTFSLDDLLAEIYDSIESGEVSPELYRYDRISTPTGRITKPGKSRAISLVVAELSRHQVPKGAQFIRLAQECLQELLGEMVEDRDIRARMPPPPAAVPGI